MKKLKERRAGDGEGGMCKKYAYRQVIDSDISVLIPVI